MSEKDTALKGIDTKADYIRDDADDKIAAGMAYRRNQRKGKRGSRRKGARK